MKKSDQKLLQARLSALAQPPQNLEPKADSTDEISQLYGGQVDLPRSPLPSPEGTQAGAAAAPDPGSAQPTSAHLGSPQPDSAQPGSAHLGSARPTSAHLGPVNTSSKKRRGEGPARRGAPAPVAADRDFNRRPNSLERDALPQGMFPGTSKKLYDALFLRTRGALIPTRQVKARRSELMKWAGIGSRNTFLSHMRHLTSIGLIIRHFEVGSNDGALYEVCIPEEIDQQQLSPDPGVGSPRLSPPQPGSGQLDSAPNLVLGSAQNVGRAEVGQNIERDREGSGDKTFINTSERSDDDEALAALVAKLKTAAREVTGKETSPSEAPRWGEVADVLVTELKIAAARTSVSSAPSFLAEHLRRRLWKKERGKGDRDTPLPQADLSDSRLTAEQVRNCPDCGGTGFYYPQGYEGGVAKCRHEKLEGEGK